MQKIVIDVRTAVEYEIDHLDSAINIPVEVIHGKIGEVITDKNTPLLVYCASGSRSKLAKVLLDRLGYTNVIDGGALKNLK